jgi:hypothetical protein
MKNLLTALIKAAKESPEIRKNMEVGEGRNAYKATSYYDVMKELRLSLNNNGLILIPKSYAPSTSFEKWEGKDKWGNLTMKQNTFVDLSATYTLWHESGEFLDIPALGHGTDQLDKAAGKATTYAMKNALLYLLNIAVGGIDDTDTEHSNDKEVPVKEIPKSPEKKTKPIAPEKTVLSAIKLINLGEGTIKDVENSKHFYFTSDQIERIKQETNATKKEN